MTTEDKLKNLILNRYHSIRDFTNHVGLPYTTLDSMFRRGIANSSVSNVIKVCKALSISVDALADGEIAPIKPRTVTPAKDMLEVNDILDSTKEVLTHGGKITLDGNPIGKADVDYIIDSMDVVIEVAKRRQK